ncbi:glutamyl-tRNA reductase [Aneurinibacillus aneurinilyticus]|jgi:glutamyl-tRNA reductase|uniref:Glutamyl-tRNA reductase n=2 Tax=Aneurinibacillus aneurinilyticus TaxID=1391 RepID=A0A848D228_ANEAE|nr:glutamyl-tRNA reductase [Aneurinibacillus aneurinilyticus]ERI11562.1 glutamyl-tRNA reductase [Aneurinibacillus aneurinilyticus ATCC 12856]MCI1693835.1 glutamyl-tRNA reductase [Aneurinibacillus aneurinilyticus]MED0671992.1 glutamyl-tRNA reductase [Aneurinibacillus aneurinilyticus]MED0706163.1 glutamyl-tRNA reductase [Aneurinibacillus aneurinilyticus]MED0724553.1 glutamyl-tRNA reductase [Aneurinibacillus aneurinilyticus]
MHILTIGLNYRTAPVEIRERFAFLEQDKPEALAKLQNTKSILECVIVGTCNRTEIYAVVDQLHTGRHFIKNYLSEWFDVPREEFIDHIYIKENDAAVRHLFHVVCGLDSMVLGETQILGQIKDAYALSQSQGATGTVFNKLFQQAITLAKRAHSETEINKNAVSTSYAAIELGKKVFGYFDNKTVLVLGAGKMSELTAKHLHANGAPRVLVANRTYERAVSLAEKFRGMAMPMEQLQDALVLADIVISSTGSDDYVVTKRDVETIMRKRRQRPLFMIDIAVPRDLDPAINDLDGVYLYDIDDLEGIVAANMRERAREAEKIGIMIGEELVTFKAWLNTLGVGPLISALREKLLTHQQEAMRNIENKCPELTEKEIRMINKQTRSLINQIMHDPIVRIKEMAGQPGADEALDMFIKLFALENSFEEAEQEAEEKEASYIPVRHRRALTEQQAF